MTINCTPLVMERPAVQIRPAAPENQHNQRFIHSELAASCSSMRVNAFRCGGKVGDSFVERSLAALSITLTKYLFASCPHLWKSRGIV